MPWEKSQRLAEAWPPPPTGYKSLFTLSAFVRSRRVLGGQGRVSERPSGSLEAIGEVTCFYQGGIGLFPCPPGGIVVRASRVKVGQCPCQAVQRRRVDRDGISRALDLANNARALAATRLAHLAARMVWGYPIQGQEDGLDGDEGARCFCGVHPQKGANFT